MNTQNQSSDLVFAACVGLDWADKKHAISLRAAGAVTVERASLDQTPAALAAWAEGLRTRFPNGRIAICVEQSRGPLIGALLAYEHLVLYPINPKSLARFRETFYPSRSKDDPIDADLLLDMIGKHRDRLRPWQPDTVTTRQLALLNEQRRHFVDQRTAFTNELGAHLKAIFPQAFLLVGEELGSRMATDFLKKWPTLQAVKKINPTALRKFYYGHHSRSEELMVQRLELIKNAVPLTVDPALVAAHTLAIRTLVGQLEALRPFLDEHDQQIAELFAAHPDQALFASLPGVGPVLGPRLLAALGTDRQRYPTALALSNYSGIAPITEKSGQNQHWVHLRWHCPKFLRQSWHEFADSSRKFPGWARTCYTDLVQRMDHHEAIRKLAFKWQRVVWRLWQDRQLYDEARYVRALQKRSLKIYADLVVASPDHDVNKN
jgi:transposase